MYMFIYALHVAVPVQITSFKVYVSHAVLNVKPHRVKHITVANLNY